MCVTFGHKLKVVVLITLIAVVFCVVKNVTFEDVIVGTFVDVVVPFSVVFATFIVTVSVTADCFSVTVVSHDTVIMIRNVISSLILVAIVSIFGLL